MPQHPPFVRILRQSGEVGPPRRRFHEEQQEVIHALLESPDPHRFVMTGSSARKLRRGGVDLPAGRTVVRTMHPSMASELDEFDLETALVHGLLPLAIAADRPEDVLGAYAALYLEEEVRLEDMRSLKAFGEDYPQSEFVLLWRGARREKHGRIHILPVEEFLRSLTPGRAFPIG